jgi:hypothetical protein
MFVYVNNMTLMVQPQAWSAYFGERGGGLLNLKNSAYLPRFLHYLVSALAVAGLFTALVERWRRKGDAASGGEEGTRKGLKIFAVATCLQLGVGIWFLMALPRPIMLAFMGRDLLATVVLMAGLAVAVASIVTAFLKKLWPTVFLLVTTVLLMVVSRANLRSLYLDPHFNPSQLELQPQYTVMALFLVVFVIGLISVGYMVKAAYSAAGGGER